MKKNKNFREVFNHLEAPIDKEALWFKINEDKRLMVKKQKKRRRVFIPILFLISLLSYFIIQKTLTSELTTYEVAKEQSGTRENVQSNFESTHTKSEESTSLIKQRKLEVLEKEVDENSGNETFQINKVGGLAVEVGKEVKDSGENSIRIQKNKKGGGQDNKDLLLSLNAYRPKLFIKDVNINDWKENSANNKVLASPKIEVGLNSLSINKSDKTAPNDVKEETRIVENSFELLPLMKNRLLLDRHLSSPQLAMIEPIKVANPNWSIGLQFGIGKPDMAKTLLLDSLNDFNMLGKHLDRNTKTIESYHIGFNLRRDLNNGLFLKFESELSYYYEQFNTMQSKIDYIENVASSNLFSRVLTEADYTYFHRYRSLQINASIGKSFQWKRLGFFISGGLQYNLNFDVKGKYQDVSGRASSLEKIDIFKDQLPLAFRGEVGLELPIADRLSFYSSLATNTAVRINDSNVHFNQRLQSRQLNLGARVWF